MRVLGRRAQQTGEASDAHGATATNAIQTHESGASATGAEEPAAQAGEEREDAASELDEDDESESSSGSDDGPEDTLTELDALSREELEELVRRKTESVRAGKQTVAGALLQLFVAALVCVRVHRCMTYIDY